MMAAVYLSCFLCLRAEEVRLRLHQKDQTVRFAAEELIRYFQLMTDKKNIAEIETDISGGNFNGPILQLGLFSDFKIPLDGIADPELDDAVYIKVNRSSGIIAGSNSRSVLFAAYRFLEANGCRWIRPTANGDFVPKRSVLDLKAEISDRAFYRWRGNSNCGTFAIDDVIERIAWSPKVGLNVFLIEFMLPRRQYINYAGRPYPSLAAPRDLTINEVRAYHDLSVKEIKKRGLIYHGVGHGWTTLVAGCSEFESDHNSRPTPDPDKIQFLALVNGERSMKNGPTFTDICHGNPDAQKRFAQCVADYAAKHPEIDYLHVWLDDRPNNTCECDRCTDQVIADSYVRLLNRIDDELTRRNQNTKIVFIIYHETLWKPLKERFKKTDRFQMMFAPIARDYTKPYPQIIPDKIDLSPYVKNKCKVPKETALNIALMKDWQTIFPKKPFAYEYHMTWHHYRDLGYYNFVKVMTEDIKRMKKIGLDGIVSCQIGRASFPTAFPNWMYAKYQWDPNRDFDQMTESYFKAAFGPDWKKAFHYLKDLSNDSVYNFSGLSKDQKNDAIQKMKDAEDLFRKFRPIIKDHEPIEPQVLRDSWKYLGLHSLVYEKYCQMRQDLLKEKTASERKKSEQALVDIIAQTEEETHPVFDLFWFCSRMGKLNKYVPAPVKKD